MPQHPVLVALMVTAGLAALVPRAQAAATSSASISNFSWELVDLAPGDGITPWITFAGSSSADAWVSQTTPPFSDGVSNLGLAAGGSVDAQAAGPYLSAQSAVTATGAQSANLSSTGTTQGVTGTPGPANYSAYSATSTFNSYSAFTLSPGTLLLLRGTATASASADHPWGSNAGEYAAGLAYLNVQGPSGLGQQSAYDYLYVDTLGAGTQASGDLGVSFVNLSKSSVNGSVYAYTSAWGQSFASAVPEPTTASLLGSGLLAVGLLSRRRR